MLNYLKAMAVFAAVVDCGSFTQAGHRLGLPRGKVSDQVKRLESFMGVRLLQRSTRSVVVTPEGNALYQSAQHLLKYGAAGIEEVKSFNEELKGTIRITVTQDFLEGLLLPVLTGFKKDYPAVEFDLVVTDEVIAVIDNSIDIAIRSGELPDSSLISTRLLKTKFKLYAGPIFPVELITHPEQLAAQPWLILSSGFQKGDIELNSITGEKAFVQIEKAHRTNSIGAYLRLMEQDYGIGIMSEHSAKSFVEQGKLKPVLADWWFLEQSISMVYPAREFVANRTRLLIDRIKSTLAEC